MNADVIVIGGGLVGSSIAFGLSGQGLKVLVLDGNDRDFRASNANGGLVWQNGKGLGMLPYQQLTRTSVDLWPGFRDALTELSGIDIPYRQTGGLHLCMSDAEYEQRSTDILRLHNQLGGQEPDMVMVDRAELSRLVPKVAFGPEVTGASLGRRDGFANPLLTLSALHVGILRRGGQVRGGVAVDKVTSDGKGGFVVAFGAERVSAAKVVIAAGLGSKAIAAQVGLDIPIMPLRGQILITERVEPFLPLPILGLAQMPEGTVMIGTTQEAVGLDPGATAAAAASMSTEALRWIPALRDLKIVRQWAGLRVMSPDGFPIYAQSATHPGAFVATCHSGVTLAAAHAGPIAAAIATGAMPSSLDVFHHRRFDLPEAA